MARASGCRGLVIGFESLAPDSLAAAGETVYDVRPYREAGRMLHAEGIAILGCFIFGFDGESPSIFERTVEFVNRHHFDLVLYSAYTPFPGTKARARLQAQGRLLPAGWDRYDDRHVVFQ